MALIFDIKAVPSAGRKGWVMNKNGQLKCYLKSPAEKNKANKELIKNLANVLGIAQDMIMIIHGAKTRKKRIKIDVEMTFNMLLTALGIEWSMDMFG